MRIDVTFATRPPMAFSTAGEAAVSGDALASSPAVRPSSAPTTSAACLLVPRLDLLGTPGEGLRVDIWWYSTDVDEWTGESEAAAFGGAEPVPELGLEVGRVWRVLPEDALGDVLSVDVDGRWRAERLGGELRDLSAYLDAERRLLSPDLAARLALDERVCEVHRLARALHPGWGDREACAWHGCPYDAWVACEAMAYARGGGGEGGALERIAADAACGAPAGAMDALCALGFPPDAVADALRGAARPASAAAGDDDDDAYELGDGWEGLD